MLEHDEAYGGSHYSMALVLKHKRDSAGALRAIQTAKRCWKEADPGFSELKAIDEVERALRSGKGE